MGNSTHAFSTRIETIERFLREPANGATTISPTKSAALRGGV
jgi:hypothetical protein